MLDHPSAPLPPSDDHRERRILRSVESLFRHCESSAEPILAYKRAQSKIGYLAGDGVRGALCHIESALCERRHALLAANRGQPDRATEHHQECGRDLQSFQRALRHQIDQPPRTLSTPELTDRIRRNLEVGQWRRASLDLDTALERMDLAEPLPRLAAYLSAQRLTPERFAQLQATVDRYNGAVERRDPQRSIGVAPADLSTPQIRARIHDDLTTGRWDHVRVGLNELARRPDIGMPLPDVEGYPLVHTLSLARRESLEARVDRCDDAARAQRGEESLKTQPAQAVRAHVDAALRQGDWDLARLALNELARRPSIGASLPELEHYPRAKTLHPEQQDALRHRISHCNARAEAQNLHREWRGESRHPEYEKEVQTRVARSMQALHASRALEAARIGAVKQPSHRRRRIHF